jgi:hypothetical protein
LKWLIAACEGNSDEGEAALCAVTEEDVIDWYVRFEKEPVPLASAHKFVSAMLSKYGC